MRDLLLALAAGVLCIILPVALYVTWLATTPTHNILSVRAAGVAYDAFVRTTGQEDESEETNIVDLLADLMHLCEARDVSFDDCLDRARRHFADER